MKKKRNCNMNKKTLVKRILLIDDDPDMVYAISLVLQNAGYEVRDAMNGQEGIRAAVEEKPDLILLDFFMPEKDGFETCSDLRRNSELCGGPILALTAFGQDIGEIYGMARQGASPQIRDYLEKPFDPNVLLERVSMALAARPQ
jgi:two-component system, OmpR family, alkaline phosphatase synthesis response regulator PhoP